MRTLEDVHDKTAVKRIQEIVEQHTCRATIVIEEPYIDLEFLEDYSDFYSTVFRRSRRYCRRLHFFDSEIAPEAFREAVGQGQHTADEDFLGHCIGRVVVKPLPTSFIGRTLMDPPPLGGKRMDSAAFRATAELPWSGPYDVFPCSRPYKGHIAGREVEIESLAYQEQDQAVSACATTAVWTALHKAGKLFDTSIPAPAQITRLAGRDIFDSHRNVPAIGLHTHQVCKVFEQLGLEAEVRGKKGFDECLGFLFAYAAFGIPVFLGLKFLNFPSRPELEGEGHAVTLTGFRIGTKRTRQLLLAHSIERVYVHDDQFGPYMVGNVVRKGTLETEGSDGEARQEEVWNRIFRLTFDATDNQAYYDALIAVAVAPVHPRICLDFEDVLQVISKLQDEFLDGAEVDALGGRLEWDIRLGSTKEIHRDYFTDTDILPSIRQKVLTRNWPTYVWRAIGRVDGIPQVELIFDASDPQRPDPLEAAVLFTKPMRELAQEVFLQEKALNQHIGWPWGRAFGRALRHSKEDFTIEEWERQEARWTHLRDAANGFPE